MFYSRHVLSVAVAHQEFSAPGVFCEVLAFEGDPRGDGTRDLDDAMGVHRQHRSAGFALDHEAVRGTAADQHRREQTCQAHYSRMQPIHGIQPPWWIHHPHVKIFASRKHPR